MSFRELSANQARIAIDLKQTYEAYRDARRAALNYAGGIMWKRVKGTEYLIKVITRTGGNKSVGPRSEETERIYNEFVAGKARSKEREAGLEKTLGEFAGMAREIGINRVPSLVTAALRRLDNFGLLGKNLMVIGTNAFYAYESAAGAQFDAGLLATTDIDFLWDARATLELAMLDDEVKEAGVLSILRKIDKPFEPVHHQPFRAVNKDGFFVDIVKQTPNPPWKTGAPSRIASGDLSASWRQNIKWLLSAEKFSAVVIGQDGQPAPMVAPDPRAFAVYKHWLSQQPDREPEKRRRDMLQGHAVIELLRVKFPHLPLDENAERMFPMAVRSLPREPGFAL